jgi:hypothetical protein
MTSYDELHAERLRLKAIHDELKKKTDEAFWAYIEAGKKASDAWERECGADLPFATTPLDQLLAV